MAAGDLVVNGTTYSLPAPMQNGWTEEPRYRGQMHRMASGAPVWEFTSTTAYPVVTLEWRQLTAAQKTVVENAVAALVQHTTGTFTPWPSGTWTVVLGEGGLAPWSMRRLLGTATYFYSGKLTLERTA